VTCPFVPNGDIVHSVNKHPRDFLLGFVLVKTTSQKPPCLLSFCAKNRPAEPIENPPRREIIACDPQACRTHAVPDEKARHHDHKGGSDTPTLCIGIDIKTEKLARKRQRARALWPAMAKTNDAGIRFTDEYAVIWPRRSQAFRPAPGALRRSYRI